MIDLKEYEEICPTCNGNKIVYDYIHYDDPEFERIDTGKIVCPECKGKGKIDWIDKIKKIKVGDN